MKTTKHYQNDRQGRENFIRTHIGDEGHPLASFLIDTGHYKGPQIHTIYTSGVIVIKIASTGQIITKLIGTVGKVKRYLKGWNGQVKKTYDWAGVEVKEVKFPHYLWHTLSLIEQKGWEYN